jgi:hypothetical protein
MSTGILSMFGCYQLNKFKLFIENRALLSRLLACLVLFLPASSFGASSEYEQWKEAYAGEFKNYKDEIDKEFSEFLKLNWKEFDTKPGVKRDPAPKPVKIPSVKPRPGKPLKPLKPVALPDGIVLVKPPVILPPVAAEGDNITIVFLGHKIDFFVNVDRKFKLADTINQNNLQQGFDHLAQSDYENLIADLAQLKLSLHLNDWAYLQLVRQVSQSFHPQSANSARLFSWFLLLKAGIKSRIAFANNEIYLLIASKQKIYDSTFFRFESDKFYVVSEHNIISSDLYSYNGQYPKQLGKLDFSGINDIITGTELGSRTIKFNYGGVTHEIKVPFNKHVIEFLSSYPQMDIDRYFNVAISRDTQQSFLTQLKPLVNQLSNEEAVNLLLRLVQTGFEYKTDKVQFGKENYLFLEETIFYPSSDCEDRAVIFAWLVENLLDIEVVGLSFPGHVATAVRLDNPSGSVIEYQGNIYTIADPTYINASLGKKMPQFKSVQPKVISRY